MRRDLNLWEFGRKELTLAEAEMPGLMAVRAKVRANARPKRKNLFASRVLRMQYGKEQPLKGIRVSGSLHMTIQTGVLIETLVALGAKVRWASCNIYSTQDHAASAIVKAGVPVFAWKGETLEEYWETTWEALHFSDSESCQLLVDDGGDATLLLHRGFAAEKVRACARVCVCSCVCVRARR